MIKTRIIPVLLLKNNGLVKTIQFKTPRYVGDPINAVKVFNDKEVDEIIILDITATIEGKKPQFDLINDIAGEAFMPFAYGGGINTIDDIRTIFRLGVEKVVINTSALINPDFIQEAAQIFGSQSIVVAIDIKKSPLGKYIIKSHSGTQTASPELFEYLKRIEELGAGELFINSIDHDGKRDGYDLKLIQSITSKVHIPVIACGGAGKIEDCAEVISAGGVQAAAAGSLFVFYGPHQAVLINYPTQDEMKKLFEKK